MRNKIVSVAFALAVASVGLYGCSSSKNTSVDSAVVAGTGGGDDAAAGTSGGGTSGGGTGGVGGSGTVADGGADTSGASPDGGNGACPPSTATTHVDIINA